MTRLSLAFASLALAAAPADAEQRPRLEAGAQVAAVIPILFEDAPMVVVGAGPRLGVNLTPAVGVDLFAEALGPVESAGSTFGLYGADVRLPLRRGARRRSGLSFTIGLAGGFSYTRRAEVRVRRLDGSIAVHPAYRRFRSQAPSTIVLGVQRTRVVSRHAAVSLAAQTYFGALAGFALRAFVGVALAPGGYR